MTKLDLAKRASEIRIEPMTPVIGAEIEGIDLSRPLTPSQQAEIVGALREWKVLSFRDQSLSNDSLKEFGRTFGKLTAAHPNAEGYDGHPEIWQRSVAAYRARVTEAREQVLTRSPPKDYKSWHIDLSFVVNPVKCSILYGVDIPPFGGDTLFASLAEVYRGLSPSLQHLAEREDVVHQTDDHYQVQGQPRREGRNVHSYASSHPLVTVHPETGEKQLYVNPSSMTHIVGMSERESRFLLDFFCNEITRPEYAMRYRWRPGSVVVWDNRAVVHAGPIDYAHFDAPRIVRRVTVEGEIPIAVDGRRSRSLHGDAWCAL